MIQTSCWLNDFLQVIENFGRNASAKITTTTTITISTTVIKYISTPTEIGLGIQEINKYSFSKDLLY